MKPSCIGSFLLLGAPWAQSPIPEIAFDSAPNFLQAPCGSPIRRMLWGRRQLQRTCLRIHARQHHMTGLRGERGSVAGIRPGRQVSPGNRQEPLCLVLCARSAHRQGRQYLDLGDRQGIGHDRAVQPGGSREHGFLAAKRKHPTRPRLGHASPRRAPRLTVSSASRPTSPGTRKGTSSSVTATSTRE